MSKSAAEKTLTADNVLLYYFSRDENTFRYFAAMSGSDYNVDKDSHAFPGIGDKKACEVLLESFDTHTCSISFSKMCHNIATRCPEVSDVARRVETHSAAFEGVIVYDVHKNLFIRPLGAKEGELLNSFTTPYQRHLLNLVPSVDGDSSEDPFHHASGRITSGSMTRDQSPIQVHSEVPRVKPHVLHRYMKGERLSTIMLPESAPSELITSSTSYERILQQREWFINEYKHATIAAGNVIEMDLLENATTREELVAALKSLGMLTM